jgi:hypothetical protein
MNARTARRSLVAAGVAALIAGQGAALAAPDDKPLRVTKSYNATGDDLAPTRTYSAPYMAVDPTNPKRIVASTPEFRTKQCKLLVSTDAGRKWKILDSTPSPQSYPFCMHTSGTAYQTAVAFGRDGTLYYALSGYDNNDLTPADAHGGVYGNISVLLARSNDLGENWTTEVVRSTRGTTDNTKAENNRPVTGLAVDTQSGDQDIVYVGWRRNAAPGVQGVVGQAMLSVSTDGGRTFGEPIQMADAWAKTKPEPTKWGGNSPQLAVAKDGTLYGAFLGTSTVTPAPPGGSNAIVVVKSTDRGRTFTFAEAAPPSPYYLPLIMTWSDTGGPQGTVHILYEDKTGPTAGLSDRDIFYKRSTDGGKTFSAAKVLNDDDPDNKEPGGGHLQVNPNIAVAPNGRIDVSWWDFRHDTGGFTNDVYYAYSNDNGTTWSKNIRISDRSIDRRVGIWSNGYDMRTPVGMAATNDLAVLAWDDTRNTIRIGDGQDIFSGVVQYNEIGGGDSNAARYALAALAGLAAVGLLLLGVAFLASRRGRPVGVPGASKAKADTTSKVDAKK